MPVHTQKDAVLKLSLVDGGTTLEAACQIIDADFTQPSTGDPTSIPVACGGDPVVEPGDPVNGAITGNVFKDTTATGITRLLAKAVETGGKVFDYTYTENAGTAEELSFTGKATVAPFGIPFAPDKYGRHPLNLVVSTAHLADAHTP